MAQFHREDDQHSCQMCEHWGGDVASGSHAKCVRGGLVQVVARPEFGCSFWVRAVGADDEFVGMKRK